MKKFLMAIFFFALTTSAVARSPSQPPTPYCEGHPKKVVTGMDRVMAIQNELDQYDRTENLHNGRYELCFQITDFDQDLVLGDNRSLSITNTSDREVVIGLLKAIRSDGSATPIIEIHGSNATLFQPTFTNVKKGVVYEGNEHKLIGGTITGVASAADSLCVDGTGNNIEIKDAVINDCVNAIRLNGNNGKIGATTVAFSNNSSSWPTIPETELLNETFVSNWLSEVEVLRSSRIAGTCLDVSGTNNIVDGLIVNECNGVGFKVSGSGRIKNSRVIGEPIPDDLYDLSEPSGYIRRSSDCLLLQEASNVTLESNTFTHCQKGVHVVDSQSIYIGPNQIRDFAEKKNDIHHNDYAIQAERRSQTVYARHNSVHENGFETENQEEFYRFGFWLNESNLIFNGENQILPSPKMDPADGHEVAESELEYPVVKYDASGNAFVDIKVPVQVGKIELSFPLDPSRSDENIMRTRYQSSTPFADCSFKDASPSPQSPPIEGGENDGGVEYLIRCPIQVTDDIKGKRLLAILHGNPIGSSQYAKALGIINDPTGIPVTGSAPTTGNMTGVTTVAHAGEVSVATGGGGGGGSTSPVSAGGGKAPGCGGSIVGKKTGGPESLIWYTLLTVIFVLMILRGILWSRQKRI